MKPIRLRIKDENELYNPLDPDEYQFSDEIKGYILGKLSKRIKAGSHEIVIQSQGELDKARIQSAISAWIHDEAESIAIERKKNRVRQTYLFALGLAFVVISLALEGKVGAVWFTVLSTIGGFSIWEAANVWIVENPKLRLKRRAMEKLKSATKISFEKL